MARLGSTARLWSPHPTEIRDEFRDAVATCLSTAFSSGVWASSPMPIGDNSDRQSAHGIISEFGENAQALVASDKDEGQPLLGCVLGGLLDENLIATYRLATYGARTGDGLLAYIGVLPSAQGSRVIRLRDNVFKVLPDQANQRQERDGDSLAGLLFSRWLGLSAIRSCPRVFVRTRKVIGTVLHLIEKNGFEYFGRFDLDFNGERQDRLVFGRSASQKFSSNP